MSYQETALSVSVHVPSIELSAGPRLDEVLERYRRIRANAVNEIDPASEPIGWYRVEANRYPLLTREEEVVLAQCIETGKQATENITDPLLSESARAESEIQISVASEAGDYLICANLRLVYSLAQRHEDKGVPLFDLIQEGNTGLMKAAERFDWRMGIRFSTYATWWIRKKIIDGVVKQNGPFLVPVHMVEKMRKVERVSDEWSTTHSGEDIPEDVLLKESGLTPKNLQHVLMLGKRKIVSFQQDCGLENSASATVSEIIEDPNAENPECVALERMVTDELDALIEKLSPREQALVREHSGYYSDREERMLKQIGAELGITKQRVLQIIQVALDKLRVGARRRGLNPIKDQEAQEKLSLERKRKVYAAHNAKNLTDDQFQVMEKLYGLDDGAGERSLNELRRLTGKTKYQLYKIIQASEEVLAQIP